MKKKEMKRRGAANRPPRPRRTKLRMKRPIIQRTSTRYANTRSTGPASSYRKNTCSGVRTTNSQPSPDLTVPRVRGPGWPYNPVGSHPMNLAAFITARRPAWKEIEALLNEAERQDITSLGHERARRLVDLYRRASADLIQARTYGAGVELVRYLETLVARGYALLYPPPPLQLRRTVGRFFGDRFPRAVRREAKALALVTGAFLGGLVLGGVATRFDPEATRLFVPEEHQRMRPHERVEPDEKAERAGRRLLAAEGRSHPGGSPSGPGHPGGPRRAPCAGGHRRRYVVADPRTDLAVPGQNRDGFDPGGTPPCLPLAAASARGGRGASASDSPPALQLQVAIDDG